MNPGSHPGAALNFGAADFYKGAPAGHITPLAGTVEKSLESWSRMWLAGRESEYGGSETRLSRPQEQSEWVRSAMDLVLRQITPLDLQWKASEEAEEVLPADSKRAAFWKTPARTRAGAVSRRDAIELLGAWYMLRGVAFIVLDDTWLVPPGARNGLRERFLIARPDAMRPLEDEPGGEVQGWTYRDGAGRAHVLLPEQVIAVRQPNPFDEIMGLSNYAAASVAAEADVAGGKFARNLAASNGSKSEYVTYEGGMPTPDQIEQITAALKEKKRKIQRGDLSPTFLAGGVKVADAAISSVDAAFVTQRLQNRHSVFAAFGVPLSMADVKAAYSLGADSDARTLVWNTSMPLGCKLADAFALIEFLRSGLQLHAEFDWDEHPVNQAVQQTKLAGLEALTSRGMPMRDAGRVLNLSLPRFQGDDVGFVPFNVTPIADAIGGANDPNTPAELGSKADQAAQDAAAATGKGFTALAEVLQRSLEMKRAKAREISSPSNNTKPEEMGGAPVNVNPRALPAAAEAGRGDNLQGPLVVLNISGQGAGVSLGGSLAPGQDSTKQAAAATEDPVEKSTEEAGAVASSPVAVQLTARTRLWNQHQRTRAPFERKMISALGKVFGRTQAKTLDRLQKWADALGIKSAVDAALPLKTIAASSEQKTITFRIVLADLDKEMAQDAVQSTRPVLRATMEDTGRATLDEVGEPKAKFEAPANLPALLKTRENFIAGATNEVFEKLLTDLQEGYDAGETMDELTKRTKRVFGDASDKKARTIAATETAVVYNASRMAALIQAGVTHKEWLTAKDDRVRHDHQEADGQVQPIEEPFVIHGASGEVLMQTPCDPNAPAEQVINCRCILIAALKKATEEDV